MLSSYYSLLLNIYISLDTDQDLSYAFYQICKALCQCFLLAIINLAGAHLRQKMERLLFVGLECFSFSNVWVPLLRWLCKCQRTKHQG